MKVTRQLKSFSGVAGGQTATLDCQIGASYHQILINYSGLTLAQMTAIRVIANGVAIHRYLSGVQLDNHNRHQGRAGADDMMNPGTGILVIDFERFGLKTRAAKEVTKLGTGAPYSKDNPNPITTLSVEIDIAAAATAPALSAKAVQSASAPTGLIKKVKQFTPQAGAIGEMQIADLPRGDLINQIRFESASVNSLKVLTNNVEVFTRTKSENDLMQTDGVRAPVYSSYVLDLTEAGDGAEGLVTGGLNDLRFNLDMAAAGNVPTMVEYIGGLQG